MILTPKHRNNGKAVLVMETSFTCRKKLFGAQYTWLDIKTSIEFLEGTDCKGVLVMKTSSIHIHLYKSFLKEIAVNVLVMETRSCLELNFLNNLYTTFSKPLETRVSFKKQWQSCVSDGKTLYTPQEAVWSSIHIMYDIETRVSWRKHQQSCVTDGNNLYMPQKHLDDKMSYKWYWHQNIFRVSWRKWL